MCSVRNIGGGLYGPDDDICQNDLTVVNTMTKITGKSLYILQAMSPIMITNQEILKIQILI
jgi:hypothetical protein